MGNRNGERGKPREERERTKRERERERKRERERIARLVAMIISTDKLSNKLTNFQLALLKLFRAELLPFCRPLLANTP